MSKSRTFNIEGGGFYTLTIDDSEVKIDGYTLGSISGGTGTEFSHIVGKSNMPILFRELGVMTGEELLHLTDSYQESNWVELNSVMTKHQSDSFFWAETDWSDSIDIQVTLTGDAVVGSTLIATATATSSEGSFPVTFQWYSNNEFEGIYHEIESATDSTYTVMDADRGCFIRVGVHSRDERGFNSSFHPSQSLGPIA